MASDEETQVGYWEGIRYVPRLLTAQKARRSGKKLAIPLTQAFQLDTSSKGDLENLYLKTLETSSSPNPNEISVEVKAAGLNFRDVLNAMGLYPGDPGPLGGECAGISQPLGRSSGI